MHGYISILRMTEKEMADKAEKQPWKNTEEI